MSKILIIAGDTSGDIHASKVMKEILVRCPETEFIGIGGEKMSEIGLNKIIDLSEISVVGFWEVLRRIDKFLHLKAKIKEIIEIGDISLFIPVDYPGFNLEIAKICNDNKVKVLWYIAPQLWAWGQKRAVKLKQTVDKLLAVFPFEQQFFNQFDITTEFVGHPLLDIPIFNEPIKKYNERENNLLIMPGSRKQEIELHLPTLIKYAKIFKSKHRNYEVVFSIPKYIQKFVLDNYPYIKEFKIENDSHSLMQNSKIGLIKSGTSNLEAALLGLPFVMFYRTSLFNYIIGKRLTTVPFFSIVNILSNKLVVKELVQFQMSIKNIEKSIESMLENIDDYENKQKEFEKIKQTLYSRGTSKRVAELVVPYLK